MTDPVIDISIDEAEVMLIKIKWFIYDLIKDFLSLHKLSYNIQDCSHNGTTITVQMK